MRNIGISLGKLDSLSDGLGEFSTQIWECSSTCTCQGSGMAASAAT